jgi:lipoprotein-anchoring transpeptidase ErfK/SrfK
MARGPRRALLVLAAVALAAVPASAQAMSVARSVGGAELTGPTEARSAPSLSAPTLGAIDDTTPYTGSTMVLPVVSHKVDSSGRQWLQVRIPYRSKVPMAWIPASDTVARSLTFHLVVELGARRLDVFHYGRLIHEFPVVVGKPSTPTPSGQFFIVERVRMYSSWADGQWALATSDYSNVLQEFEGGDGQIALHAKAELVGTLGTAVSHGCVRLADGVAAELAGEIPNGTPLTIVN